MKLSSNHLKSYKVKVSNQVWSHVDKYTWKQIDLQIGRLAWILFYNEIRDQVCNNVYNQVKDHVYHEIN